MANGGIGLGVVWREVVVFKKGEWSVSGRSIEDLRTNGSGIMVMLTLMGFILWALMLDPALLEWLQMPSCFLTMEVSWKTRSELYRWGWLVGHNCNEEEVWGFIRLAQLGLSRLAMSHLISSLHLLTISC